jgi:pSer/pThr/pTyr-binding forkhead associated (FHA) protein
MAKIHIMSGMLQGKTFELIEDSNISVGRSLDNQIVLEDTTVSHHHATFETHNGVFMVRDMNSTNGTRVNGMRITESKLGNGDQVRFGSVEARFESDLRKSSQPMPPKYLGVNPEDIAKGGVPPPDFVPLSMTRRKVASGRDKLDYAIFGLGAVAALTLAYFAMRLLTTG